MPRVLWEGASGDSENLLQGEMAWHRTKEPNPLLIGTKTDTMAGCFAKRLPGFGNRSISTDRPAGWMSRPSSDLFRTLKKTKKTSLLALVWEEIRYAKLGLSTASLEEARLGFSIRKALPKEVKFAVSTAKHQGWFVISHLWLYVEVVQHGSY